MKLDHDLKRYYWSKYFYLRSHNGPKFAAATFKELRQVIMSYINDPDRISKREEYIALAPVRKNGWLRKLFVYADTQPLLTLQFLKLYTVEDEPVVSPEEAAVETDAVLQKAQPAKDNVIIEVWLWAITHKTEYKNLLYKAYRGWRPDLDKVDEWWVRLLYSSVLSRVNFAKDNGADIKQIIRYELSYLDRIRRIFTPTVVDDRRAMELVEQNLPTMEQYAFFGKGQRPVPTEYDSDGIISTGENPFEEDLMGLFSLSEVWPFETMNLMDALPEGLTELAGEVNSPDMDSALVGHIRQIPKSGTVVRRAIADPNKFLQAGLQPFRKMLRSMSNKIPRNCQFDQSKMDLMILSQINYGYAGSVDLKQATDWLPLSWFTQIENAFREEWYPEDVAESVLTGETTLENPRLYSSRELFYTMCSDGYWDNEGYISSWQRGQPLGTLPSFEILTITHFGVIESISWLLGRLDMPYALLGDDVVMFDANVRRTYINTMKYYGNPLSLQKSYEGRLTEFAGKVYVVNQMFQYCTDIQYLKWYNLFDYQRSTGVVVSYRDLPKEVKSRIVRLAKTYHSCLRPEDLYSAMQICAGVSNHTQITDVIGDLISNFYSYDTNDPEEIIKGHYGFVFMGFSGTYDQEVILPKIRRKARWWRKKNRPESTTSIAMKCLGFHDR
jgi:hypothetical protein